MEVIEEHLRSCLGVIRKPLAYDIMKTIIVQVYGYYPMHATPDNEMIARMLDLPLDKNKLFQKEDAQSIQMHTAEYKIDMSMTSWIRSACTLICIHMSNSLNKKTAEECIVPSTPDG